MLGNLREGLRTAIKRIVSSSGVDEETIREMTKDVQRALIQSDVDVKLVAEITKKIEARALGETPPPGLSRKDHIVKILYDELAGLLGGEREFGFAEGKTSRVLMLGIQGSGKTTMTAKLASLLAGQGRSVGVIGADTTRAAALVQLREMCKRSGVEVYGEEKGDPLDVVEKGLRHFGDAGPDIILVDTAGRHAEEGGLLNEMNKMGKVIKPDLSLLVIDGTIGNRCFGQAEAFHKAVPVGGIIVTKLDSAAGGGGAIAAAAATGAHVMYIGTGERIDDIEKFSPTRFVGRLLGMGDVKAVLDLAKRLEEEGDEARLKRISGGRMNMDDFYYQLEEISRSGSLGGLLESIPGISVKEGHAENLEENVKKWRYIIQSMTQEEKDDPKILRSSRIKRIALGSGRAEKDVRSLLKGYDKSKGIMKASKGRQMQGTLRRMGLG